MTVAYLLLTKILQLFVFMILGFLLVKFKVVKSDDSMVLSKISLWLLMPAAIINSFDVELTGELISGILLAYAAAVLMHVVLILINAVFKRLGNGNGTELACIMYSNAANLIVPIVTYVLGAEWVIYSCAFMSVQQTFMWTHGISLFSGRREFNLKKIFLNVNIIAIAIGAVMMVSGVKLHPFIKDITSSLSGMVGVVGMIIAGMLAAKIDFKSMLKNKRLYLIAAMRMIVCPAVMLIIVKSILCFTNISKADYILLIVFLASITPCAATLMQLAQIYDKEPEFTVSVNIATTVMCIVTMPLFVMLYRI